jgi:hypothetical protein
LPYRPLCPEDIDSSVSRDFYRYYASRNHWPDPGPMVEDQAPARELVQLKTVINNYSSRPGELKTTKHGGVSL